MTRIEILERFTIGNRGETVIYRLLHGTLKPGTELVSERYRDTWRVESTLIFEDPAPPIGVTRPPCCLLRSASSSRLIEIGEVFVELMSESDETVRTM
jgi:hypothetical protein